MATELTWLGHGSWSISIDGHHVLLDPFLNDSPTAPVRADDVEADHTLVSHGHFDHVADVASIANRTGATVVANFEIAEWFSKNHGVQNTIGMNLGAGVDLAVLPIGDLFTMGPADSIEAVKLLNPKRVAPAHYNIWHPIEQDAAAWAESVRNETSAEPIVLEPGGKIVM